MDMRVKNPTEKTVTVVWDGYPNEFKPSQVRVFQEGVAKALIEESKFVLELVKDEVWVEAPVVSEEKVEEPKVEEEVVVEPKPKKPRKKK